MTKKVVLSSVGGIWLLSGLISFLPICFGWHKPDSYQLNSSLPILDDDKSQCELDLTPTYAIISSSISFYVPCIIMVALYTRLFLYARKHVKNIKSMSKPLNIGGTCSQPNGHHNHHQTGYNPWKAAITLGVIMGVFLICWVPFFSMNIIVAFCKTCDFDLTFKIITWLGYFNSTMNPVIYSIFNTEFREAFQRILIKYMRDEICSRDPHRNSSRSATDLYENGVNVRDFARNNVNPSLKDSLVTKNRNSKQKSPSSASNEAQPIKNQIEIVYDPADGTVSAI